MTQDLQLELGFSSSPDKKDHMPAEIGEWRGIFERPMLARRLALRWDADRSGKIGGAQKGYVTTSEVSKCSAARIVWNAARETSSMSRDGSRVVNR